MPFDQSVGWAPPAGVSVNDFFKQRYNLETTNPRHADGLPKFVADPADKDSGRQVMVLHLESTDPTNGVTPAQRTEISAKKEYTPPGEERWYALSFYLDKYWPVYDTTTNFVLAQIHTSQRDVIVRPPVEVRALGEEFNLITRNNTRDIIDVTQQNTTEITTSLGKLTREEWHSFVIHAMWSDTERNGFLRIWHNGNIVTKQVNQPNCYENLISGLGNWPKMGIYAPGGFGNRWSGAKAWVKSYVDYFWIASPVMTAVQMYEKTPVAGILVEKE